MKERHIKWEKDLTMKLKTSREEKKRLQGEVLNLSHLLEEKEVNPNPRCCYESKLNHLIRKS
jgi:hypothetical protein